MATATLDLTPPSSEPSVQDRASPATRRDDGGPTLLETRFGPIQIDSDQQITFRGGLPGFPEQELYQLNKLAEIDTDLLLLQAVDSREVAFFVMSVDQPSTVLRSEDIGVASRNLDIAAGDLLLLLVVTFKRTADGFEKHVNLRAPIFVDVRSRSGTQVVLHNSDYPLRFPLS